MKFNRYQGDPAIKITEDGAEMKFTGGQPEMDHGLNNYVLIALGTKKGWWGNALISSPDRQIGSNFDRQRTVVENDTINDTTDDADKALKPMIDTGLASEIEITVTNPNMNYILTDIKIYPPGQDVNELLILQNGLNWIAQAQDPTHERLT